MGLLFIFFSFYCHQISAEDFSWQRWGSQNQAASGQSNYSLDIFTSRPAA